ncbi:MAG: DUF2927 domain-containing protein [Methanoregula sp.]|jgi:hypothetical protein
MRHAAILLVLVLGIVLLAAGCSAPVAPTTPATPVPTITGTLVAPSPSPSIIPVPLPATTVRTAYTSDEINRHFVDLAFSADNNNVSRFNSPHLTVAITGSYNDANIASLNRFFLLFNSNSFNTRLPSEVKQGEQGDIVIRFIPADGLAGVNSDNNWKVFRNPSTGTIIYMFRTTNDQTFRTEKLYINADPTGDERTHWLIRGLLYELGLPGETGTYPERIFYSVDNSVTELSPIDIKALQLLYGNKITRGMTLDDVRRVLLIKY